MAAVEVAPRSVSRNRHDPHRGSRADRYGRRTRAHRWRPGLCGRCARRVRRVCVHRLLDAQRLYLEELDVAPSHAGQRIGARLIEQVMARAAQEGIAEVVLSTFRDAPWNAPYYARLGFSIVDAAALDDTLRAIRAPRIARPRRDAARVHAGGRAPLNTRCRPSGRVAQRRVIGITRFAFRVERLRHRLVERCAEFEAARQVGVRDEQLAPCDRVGAAVLECSLRGVERELLVRDQRAAECLLQARAKWSPEYDSRVKMKAILRRPSSRAT